MRGLEKRGTGVSWGEKKKMPAVTVLYCTVSAPVYSSAITVDLTDLNYPYSTVMYTQHIR